MLLRMLLLNMLFLLSAQAVDTKRVEKDPAQGTFYHLHDLTLATHLLTDSSDEFGDLKSDKIDRLRQVPVSFLAPLGIKEKDKIQFVQFSDGKAREYVVGKKVFIYLFKIDSVVAMYKWGTFNLILTDDPKEHQKLSNLSDSLPVRANGLAYLGSQFSFTDGAYVPLELKKISPSDPGIKLFHPPRDDIRKAQIDEATLFVETSAGAPWNSSILSMSKDNFFLDPVDISFKNNSLIVHYGTFIKDYKFLISDVVPHLECSYLYLLKESKVSFKEIHCLPSNMFAQPD